MNQGCGALVNKMKQELSMNPLANTFKQNVRSTTNQRIEQYYLNSTRVKQDEECNCESTQV